MAQIMPIEFTYPSHDGRTRIYALLWTPVRSEAQAVIQITHGMQEHVWRYHDFASYLAHQGFIVCAQDLLGHGRSVVSYEDLSCLPAQNGKDILIEDAHSLRAILSAKYPMLPYVMFGHSMGSFIMRAYLDRHGKGLDAIIFCGTGHVPRVLSSGGNLLSRLIARLRGEDFRSRTLARFGVEAYSTKIKNRRTDFDWLSIDPQVVDSFIADPLCGIPFSAGAYAVLTSLTKDAASPFLTERTPTDLPVFFIAGALDPVGNEGRGVESSARLLRKAGIKEVDLKLYEGLRHEILNEPSKEQVYTDIVEWVSRYTVESEE